jgi:hypothetical protein
VEFSASTERTFTVPAWSAGYDAHVEVKRNGAPAPGRTVELLYPAFTVPGTDRAAVPFRLTADASGHVVFPDLVDTAGSWEWRLLP